MKFLNSKWFEKIFFTASSLILIWFVLVFVFGGGFLSLLFIFEIQDMDIWAVIKERSSFLIFFMILILLSIFLLVATWKSRTNTPKPLTIIITSICVVFIGASLYAMTFIISFGSNS